jgi:AraC-like DNA-binding protein
VKASAGTRPDADPWTLSQRLRGYERETFEGPTRLLPELEIFGWLRFHTALPGALKPDRHAGAYEIHYMVRGHLRWWVEGETFDFSTGRLFLIRPGELHRGDDGSLQPCEHYWLRIGLPANGFIPSLTAKETAELRGAFEKIRYRTFVASPEVREFFERLLAEHRLGPSVLSLPMARALLHALLVTIVRDHDRHCQMLEPNPLTTWRVRRALQWLEHQVHESEVHLNGIAQSLGLSPAGLRARFKAETGYTLHAYLLHRRVEEARRRLAESSDDITRIAHELGFCSSQYFATVFRRHTGATPSGYRKQHRS